MQASSGPGHGSDRSRWHHVTRAMEAEMAIARVTRMERNHAMAVRVPSVILRGAAHGFPAIHFQAIHEPAFSGDPVRIPGHVPVPCR